MEASEFRNIGVVTSGGDAPGMNAAIRTVTRVACLKGWNVIGFERGWEGLMSNMCRPLTPRSVGGILNLGGTVLYATRSSSFRTKKGVEKAAETLDVNGVDGLVVIGGDGSFRGAYDLSEKTDALIVGVPATIDNDVYGTEETIGFDTAVNTAVAEIDKIRDTATSHERTFIIEVMGGKRGFLALIAGVTAGAEIILVPEVSVNVKDICQTLEDNSSKGKKSSIIVAAEGAEDNMKLAEKIREKTRSEVRFSILGYAQRGGSPTARSRLLACLFGEKAVELLVRKQGSSVVGLRDGRIVSTRLTESCRSYKPLDMELFNLARVVAT